MQKSYHLFSGWPTPTPTGTMSDMDEGGEGEMGDAIDPATMGEGAGGSGGLVLPGVKLTKLFFFVADDEA